MGAEKKPEKQRPEQEYRHLPEEEAVLKIPLRKRRVTQKAHFEGLGFFGLPIFNGPISEIEE